MGTHPFLTTPPSGDPGYAVHHATDRRLWAVDADDGYLWVCDPHAPRPRWDRLPMMHRVTHVTFTPALASEHGWWCDATDVNLWCVDCLSTIGSLTDDGD